jgi:F-type H+-transporting ATPase subunit b
LKRFLYKPILNAVDAREKLIAAELADAAAKKADAKQVSDTFHRKNEAFDQQRTALLSKATSEAAAERQRLLDEARKAADAFSAKRQDALRADAQTLNAAIRRLTQQEVFAIARKALTDLADASLEDRMAEVFTCRLQAMDGKAKAAFAKALKTTGEPTIVRSAFDLPAAQRSAIQKALHDDFSAHIKVCFETSPALVSGVELSAGGQKISWSIADYLGSLEEGVADLLREDDKPTPKAAPKPVAKSPRRPKPAARPKNASKAKKSEPGPKSR